MQPSNTRIPVCTTNMLKMQAERVTAGSGGESWIRLVGANACSMQIATFNGVSKGNIAQACPEQTHAIHKLQDSRGSWIQYCKCFAAALFLWHNYTAAFCFPLNRQLPDSTRYSSFKYIWIMQFWKSMSLYLHCFKKIMNCNVYIGGLYSMQCKSIDIQMIWSFVQVLFG